MDPRLLWLDLTLQETRDLGESLAPPPVLFGHASNTDLQKTPENRAYMFANALADNLQRTEHPPSEDSISLSLTAQELTLEESKTYMRWYLDILARTNLRTISMNDVYQFLSNFRLLADAQEKINRLFSKILHLINIGEFFALLRVVSHTLAGEEPSRRLIKIQTSVPTPPSILLKKRQNDDEEEPKEPEPVPELPSKPLDLDLFTQFMLTGERPDERIPKKRSKKLKLVKFSDQIVTDVHDPASDRQQNAQPPGELDYLLPMDQLMNRLNASKAGPSGSSLQVPRSSPGPIHSPDPEEKQILRDMEPQMNHFQNLNSVDTMLVDGVPANIHLGRQGYTPLPQEGLLLPQPQLLQPNMTGPAQMAQLIGRPENEPQPSPLRSQVTGPNDMARFLPPEQNGENHPRVSLQSFTSQMTGDTLDNTAHNARIADAKLPPPPPPVPARRSRSVSQPNSVQIDHHSYQHEPTNGDSNNEAFQRYRSASLSPAINGPPVPPRSPLNSRPGPPPPPPSRRRGNSNAVADDRPPLPPKVPEQQIYQNLDGSSSTANILDDLKALQEEVDKIRDMTGGF
ncbi:hypothetical protein C7M61_002153 [Candidozyma pseudohaemuli]|uniref:Protein SCD5 n=1 Tax=Candidozyma pseudohaemuli TaxID=418784 RepID=A0A2P7YSB9_9ASCO|nr:hypothetical protein C7M61_002153 [[Candida] pseudohaemulonii]PSK38849.1 hypothetical protein C7M61_002153 [[Candida] pseudohaemulonii]